MNIKITNLKKLFTLTSRTKSRVLTALATVAFSATAFAQSVTYTYGTNGSGTFVVPSCVTSITVQAWGAGGGGGYRPTGAGDAGGYGNSGGGGGAYETATFTVQPGQTYDLSIGKGGSGGSRTIISGDIDNKDGGETTFKLSTQTLLKAQGGQGANNETVENSVSPFGNGGVKTTTGGRNGGKGGKAGKIGGIDYGGGGGGAGYPGGIGGVGAIGSGGGSSASNLLGGKGGDGGTPASNVGSQGIGFGGGGGGALKFLDGLSPVGGDGAHGGIIITYNIVNKTFSGVANTNTGNWNVATNWIPATVPLITDCVVIPTGKTVTISNGNAVAKNISVASGAVVTVSSGRALKVEETVLNNGTINVNSGGNFLQTSSSKTSFSGNGTFSAKKDVTDMNNLISSGKRDFVYWSSPVAAQIVQSFSPGTPNNQRLQYTEATDYFIITPDLEFLPAKGYALGAETNLPDGYSTTYTFTGKPNNGDYSVGITKAGQGYNLVGNPYPSNIDFDLLYANNSTIILNKFWRWRNDTYTAGQQGAGYIGNNYIVYNGTGGQTPSTSRQIVVGQGFIVEKSAAGSANLNFFNSDRVSAAGNFFQKSSSAENRFWLTLTSPTGITNTQLIGYTSGATNGFDINFDAEALDLSSDLFYTPLLGKKLVVQGKDAGFQVSDNVKLGANFFSNGNYTISIEQPEGIFSNSQNVFLKDNLLNTYTDLKLGSYTFAASAGLNESRFEIVYEQSVLGTSQAVHSELIIYKKGENYIVLAPKSVDRIEVLDAAGRLLKIIPGSSTTIEIGTSTFSNGVYILNIKYKDGTILAKKIKK